MLPRPGSRVALLGLAAAFVTVSCTEKRVLGSSVVVTSAMLEHVFMELIPEDEQIEVVSLLPPGSCPGHFDLAPSALPTLRSASLVVRHDFQEALDGRISSLGARDVAVVAVSSHGSLLVPDNFIMLASEAAEVLAERIPRSGERIRERLADLEARVSALGKRLIADGMPWRGTNAVASAHQKAFAEWLGLTVTGVMRRPEDMSPGDLQRLFSGDAAIVIGNLQEGARAAMALGERKGIPVAVFSNFPGVESYGSTYENLVMANMERLRAAWAKR